MGKQVRHRRLMRSPRYDNQGNTFKAGSQATGYSPPQSKGNPNIPRNYGNPVSNPHNPNNNNTIMRGEEEKSTGKIQKWIARQKEKREEKKKIKRIIKARKKLEKAEKRLIKERAGRIRQEELLKAEQEEAKR